MPPSWRRSPTRPPRAARSWCWPRSASTSASAISAEDHTFVPFSATTRMSGLDIDGRRIRKGAAESVRRWVDEQGGTVPGELDADRGADRPGPAPPRWWWPTAPLILGVIELKDVVKQGIREKFDEMRQMGIRTIMITGDNPLTAAAIAQEAGVDDFLAEATPEAKMALIRSEQEGGKLVAMTGDGTNDAPALAQADVGVAMNTGTTAAKEAGNMVDLDSNPTKLIDVVEIGKQLLITRGSLTTFSIANDVAKYFAIIPALFVATYPQLNTLNIMKLHSAQSAVLSAVIFNALVIVALIPLALRGVKFRAAVVGRHPAAQRLDLRRRRASSSPSSSSSSSTSSWSPSTPTDGACLMLLANLRRSVALVVISTVFFGFVYAFVGTGVAQALFKNQADGSVGANGSTLIGQNWSSPTWFHGRPDDTGPYAHEDDVLAATIPSWPTAGAASRRPPTSGPGPRSCWPTPRPSSPTGTSWA